MDLSFFLPALCYSGLLSLLGLAILLRHRASGVPDFSILVYIGFGVVSTVVAATMGWGLYFGPVLALVSGCVLGWVEYSGVFHVMERRGDGAVKRTLATLGVQFLGSGVLGCIGYWFETHVLGGLFLFHTMQKYDFKLFDYSGIFYVVAIVCVIVYAVFILLSRRTFFGAVMTASEESPELAMAQGLNPWRVKLIVWTLSGGLACVAGSLFPPFLHLDPQVTPILLIPIMAVGLLAGFASFPLAVAAAYLLGFTELYGTYWLQVNFGTWMGEFRSLIPAIILYFAMLFIPKGLTELKAPIRDAANWLRRDRRRALSLLAVVLLVVGVFTVAENTRTNAVRDERDGWINVANSVGRAGAKIYGDRAELELPESLYYSNVKWPQNLTTIHDLTIFSATIKNAKATIVYRHEGMLYLFVDEERAFVYDPSNDNYGR